MRTYLLLLLVPLATGCAGVASEVPASSAPSVSSYSSAGSSGAAITSFTGTQTLDREAGIVVRPDWIEVPFAISSNDTAPLPVLQREANELAAQLKDGTGRATTVRMRAIRFERVGSAGKDAPRTTAEGCVEIALSADLDFWARAHILAQIEAVAARRPSGKSEAPQRTVAAPVLRVKDSESHRAALLQKWMTRSRALVAAAEGESSAKLRLAECDPPGVITQGQLGPDEVLLALPLHCKIESAPPR